MKQMDFFLRPIGIWFNRDVSLMALLILLLISLLFLFIIVTNYKPKGSIK